MRFVTTILSGDGPVECDLCGDSDADEVYSVRGDHYCERCFEGFVAFKVDEAIAFSKRRCEVVEVPRDRDPDREGSLTREGQVTALRSTRAARTLHSSTNYDELVASLDADDALDEIMHDAIKTRCAGLLGGIKADEAAPSTGDTSTVPPQGAVVLPQPERQPRFRGFGIGPNGTLIAYPLPPNARGGECAPSAQGQESGDVAPPSIVALTGAR